MIQVESWVPMYEIDGKETVGLKRPGLVVKSHWNRDEFVILVVDEKAYTLAARDLDAAVTNARNSSR